MNNAAMMTFEEYRQSMRGVRIPKIGAFNREGTLRQKHEDYVRSAIQARVDIPAHVLKSVVKYNPYTDAAKHILAVYPELAK